MVFCFFLVGNKNDCPERKVVETADAQRFAEQMGIQIFETSAKENLNVEEVCFKFVDMKLCLLFIISRGYAKRRNDYCCGSEYANLSLTQM